MAIVEDQSREYVYFLYSQAMHIERTEIEEKMNKKFIPGRVLVNGKWEYFTQVGASSNNIIHGDTLIVAKGYRDQFQYEDCKNEWI